MRDTRPEENNELTPLRLKAHITVWVFFYDDEFKFSMAREIAACSGVSVRLLPIQKVSIELFHTKDLPELLFIQTGPGWVEYVDHLQSYEVETNKEMSLIIFGDDNDNAALKMSLRLGASDFLTTSAKAIELMPLFYAVAENKIASTSLAEIYTFVNTKGGTGATTIALNSAVDVAKHTDSKVLYLDLDQYFGVANDYINLNPTYSLTDAINSYSDLDDISIQSLVTKHESGLNLLSFNPDTHAENSEKAKDIGLLIPVLRRYYQYIFVDLSNGLDRLYISIFSQSTKLFVVTQQNLIALKNASRIVHSLKYEYGLANESIVLVINRYEKRQQIKLKDIEKSFVGLDMFTIPNDFQVAIESANLGEPFVLAKPNATISQAIHEFCSLFSVEIEEEKGWLGKLLG